jgi:hypothetical protein
MSLTISMMNSAISHGKQYDLFVSYNKADVEFAERLVKRVEEEDYDGRRLSCFFADWDISPGQNILLAIEKAQENSRFVALVMSPEWETSNWTLLERAMPVYDDPAGLKQRIIPVLRRKCSVPPSIRILKWLDFSNDRNFEREASRLVAWLKGESLRPRVTTTGAEAKQRIVIDSTEPDFQDETIASNLFPVVQLPLTIYSAPSAVQKRNEIFDTIGDDPSIPPFAFDESEKVVYSFADLRSDPSPLRSVIFGQKATTARPDTLLTDGRSHIIIDVLNRAMTRHMKNLGMVYDWNNKKTFFPLETDAASERVGKWRIGNRRPQRMLVRRFKGYYAHRHCKATFTNDRTQLYLKVIPGWHFTLDGVKTPVPPAMMSSLSARWMNIERNAGILNDIRFWSSVLSKDSEKLLLYVGPNASVEIATTPVLASMERGIEGDYRERMWYEEPEEDEMKEVSEEAMVESSVEEVNEQ